MLNVKAVYIVCGYTDLRSGRDSLAAVLEAQTGSAPYVPDTLYLFCGRRADRIKGLVWEKDGWLMEGLTITPKNSVRTVKPPEFLGVILCRTENFTALL